MLSRLERDGGLCCDLPPRQQGSPGGAQEAASCPHLSSGDKGSKTARQNWLPHPKACTLIGNFPFTSHPLLKASSRQHGIDLMCAEKGPASSSCPPFLGKGAGRAMFVALKGGASSLLLPSPPYSKAK